MTRKFSNSFQKARYSEMTVSGADADSSLEAYLQILEEAPRASRKDTLMQMLIQKLLAVK